MKLIKFSSINIFLLCTVACGGAIQNLSSRLSFCYYPEALKTGLEETLGKNCDEIEDEDLSQVNSLVLSENEIENVRNWQFRNFENLNSLSFEGNRQLFEIPDFVYEMEGLTELNISRTSISNFDSRICQLKNLKTLIGKDNHYENQEIPFHTFCLQNLATLDLSNSNLIYIDEYIYYLSRLESLILRGNHFYTVPYVLEYMSSLQHLDLRNNRFSKEALNQQIDCRGKIFCDVSDNYVCETSHRVHLDRGHPYRRYKTMTDEEFLDREENGTWMKDECYKNWTYVHGGFDDFSQTSGLDEQGNYRGKESKNSHLLSRTINGKTIREWRLAQKLHEESIYGENLSEVDQFGIFSFDRIWFNTLKMWGAIWSGCKWFGPEAEYWEPYLAEIFPERKKYQQYFVEREGLISSFSRESFIPVPYTENVSCRSEYDGLSFESGFEFPESG